MTTDSRAAKFDVVVIGAGVVGTSVARELSKRDASVLVLEREEDVCCGTSKANAALVHAGYDPQPGSLMATLNLEGNRLMFENADDLGYRVLRCGSLVVCTDENERGALEELLQRGIENGVEGLEIVERERLLEMEPNISDEAICALYAPNAGVVDVFDLTIALAENAAENGIEFKFLNEVQAIEKLDGGYKLTTNAGEYRARCVVNAAGLYADEIHNMVSAKKLELIPRKGEFFLLDTTAGDFAHHIIFAQPTKMGKGVAVMPTVHGNMLVGPTAIDVDDKESTDTTAEGLGLVKSRSSITMKNVPLSETITSFAGLRAHEAGHEFIIREVDDAPNFVDCVGIESPGLTASQAIGCMVADMCQELLSLEMKKDGEFKPTRKAPVRLERASKEEWESLYKEDPAYGQIICRCRKVTEAQIVDAIHRPLSARSLDAIKRRTTAGMGRCQAGFCTPKIMEILERELADLSADKITKAGPGSELLCKGGESA